MVDKVKIPEFIKEGAKSAIEPLNRLEERLSGALKKATEDKNLSPAEMKKVLKEALTWIKSSRSDLEKAFNDGVSRTLSVLNLPSRDEMVKIEKKVTKLTKDLKAIENSMSGKKPAVKKAVKKTVKKVAKKTTKKAVKKAVK